MKLVNVLKKFLWGFTTVNVLPDACIFVDNAGKILYYNRKAKALFGINDYETEPLNLEDIILNAMAVVEQSAQLQRPVLTSTKPEQNGFYVEVNAVTKRGGYSVTIRDLTKLTNTTIEAENIRRFNGEKNAMIAMLENDLKSPVTSISGFSKGLLDGLGGKLSEKQEKYIKIINSNAEELYSFIDKFTAFSRAESLMYQPDYKIFDITEVIKSVSKDFQQDLFSRKLFFDLDYSALNKYNVYSDLNAIKGAYKNILEISSAMTENGGISVVLCHPSESTCIKFGINPENSASYVQMLIKDTGVGYQKDSLKHLCDPYAQLENGKRNVLRAFTLGTASILVKRAGGYIDINTEVLEGTEYYVIFPIEKR